MIALKQAVATLDGVIPAPDNKMVDLAHLPIAVAWQECKTALATYSDMQDKHDTLRRRWVVMVETFRWYIDAGSLTQEDKRLLDDLNLPRRYDRRTAHGPCEYPPMTVDELREMGKDWVWIKLLVPHYGMDTGYYIKHEENPGRDSFQCGYPRIWVRGLPYSLYEDNWLAYRHRPEVSGE